MFWGISRSDLPSSISLFDLPPKSAHCPLLEVVGSPHDHRNDEAPVDRPVEEIEEDTGEKVRKDVSLFSLAGNNSYCMMTKQSHVSLVLWTLLSSCRENERASPQ